MQYLGYVIASILAIVLGQVTKHLNLKMPPVVKEEITYKEFYSSLFKDFKLDFKYSIILLVIYNALIYYSGFNIVNCIYFITIFVLLIVFSIDYRFQLIPDEAHIVIVLLGIINLALNIQVWYTYFLGAIIGAGIFWGLGLLALVIFKKEGMGFGDVKLMGALGFLFGTKYILVITLLSFFIGAIVGSILIATSKKGLSSYIPFGPFIVISAISLMFISPDDIIFCYIEFCTMLGRGMNDIIYNLIN